MHRLKILAVCLTLLFVSIALVSCAGLRARREAFVRANPSLPQNVKSAILEGEVVPGMSPEAVRASWGEPENVLRETGKDGVQVERWWYHRRYEGFINVYEVVFAGGRVREVRAREVRRPRRYGPLSLQAVPAGAGLPEDVVNARRYLDLAAGLSLTPGQIGSLRAARERYRLEYSQKQDLIQMARIELLNLINADRPNMSLIRDRMDEITRLQAELQKVLLAAMQEAYDVLTPEQRQTLID